MNVAIEHSAKGTSWTKKKHKYLKKVGTRYYYKKEKSNAPDYEHMTQEELEEQYNLATGKISSEHSKLKTYRELMSQAATEEDRAYYQKLIDEGHQNIENATSEANKIAKHLNRKAEEKWKKERRRAEFDSFRNSPIDYTAERIMKKINSSLKHSGDCAVKRRSMSTWVVRRHDDYLVHHGVQGMKWGVRRYQNSDGSLTAAGKIRYKTQSIPSRFLRTYFNGNVGQRAAVGFNKGYRKDKAELKADYRAKLKKLDRKSDDFRANKAKLKAEYKSRKTQAAIDTADAIFGNQSHELNKKIHSESAGKTFVKSVLLGSYGSLVYNEARVNAKAGRGRSFVNSFLANVANNVTAGSLSAVDSIVRRQTGNFTKDRMEMAEYKKEQREQRRLKRRSRG